MPTLLADPTRTMYIVFGAMVVILGAMALRRQKKSDVITFAVAAILFLALFLIDRAFESPREQVISSIREMETATQLKKHDDVFKHVSNNFKYKSIDKKGLQDLARMAETLPNWEGLKVIDSSLGREGFVQIDENTVEQKFEVQPLRMPGTEYRYDCVATFKKENGRWLLIGFRLTKDGQEVSPPGL
jgi:hypothetical protein